MSEKKKLLSLFYTSNRIVANFAHTWPPLATVFNKKPKNHINLKLLTNKRKGLFDIPELESNLGFYALKDKCILKTDDLITEAISPGRNRKMVEIFDELSDTLCKVADLAEFIRIAHPDASFAKAAEIACNTVSGIVEKLNTDLALYTALKNVVQNGDKFPTTPVDEHVARLFLFDFEQSGIHLPESDRLEVLQLNDAILHLGQHFVAGASYPRYVNVNDVPSSIRHLFNDAGDRLSVSGLYGDSADPSVRELAYKIYLNEDDHQEYLLMELLKCRYHLAQKCGFNTYGDRALKGSLVEEPKVVGEFLCQLAKDLHSRAYEEFNLMDKMKGGECADCCDPERATGSLDLAPWDVPYYTHKAKRERFNIATNEFGPYFSLGACMDGLDSLLNSLYGIRLINTEVGVGEVWTEDVYKLAVNHETDGLLGYIYCDFYERDGKPNQDCHFTIQGGKRLAGPMNYQLPIVVLMLNLPAPRWQSPSLLSPGMVDNLFHEMGHAMHSMLARTCYQHVTGTRCSTDFAEVPSVLMEYFAGDPRVLATFARHFQTGELLPASMLERLCTSKHVFNASEMQLQVFYSALDQIYHGALPYPEGTTTQVLSAIQSRYYGLQYVHNTAWQLRFTHLVGYGAKYYSYLISKAVASWIWQTYFEENPLNRQAGDKFRYECLAHGGGKPPKKLVADFLQREVTPAKLSECLIREIDDKAKRLQRLAISKL